MAGFWKYAKEDPDYVAIVDPDGTEYTSGEVLARAQPARARAAFARLAEGRHCRCDPAERPSPDARVPRRAASRLVLRPDQLPALGARGRVHPERRRRQGVHQPRTVRRHSRAQPPKRPASRRPIGLPTGRSRGFGPFDEVVDPQPTTNPENRATGAAMHYTSGTTGKPKGVKRALADIDPDTSAELFTFLLGLFGITHGDDNVHLCTSPNYHTAVTTFAGNALHSKHTVVFMDRWDPEEALRLIERYRCDAHPHGADAVHPHAPAPRGDVRRSTTCRR